MNDGKGTESWRKLHQAEGIATLDEAGWKRALCVCPCPTSKVNKGVTIAIGGSSGKMTLSLEAVVIFFYSKSNGKPLKSEKQKHENAQFIFDWLQKKRSLTSRKL